MRNYFLILLAACSLLCGGCASLLHNPDTGELDQIKVQQTATILRTTTASGLILVLQNSPDDADEIKAYLRIIETTIDGLLANETYTPDELTEAIVAVDGLDKPEVRLALTTTLGLYEIYFAQYVSGQINENLLANQFLSAFRNGIALAIE